MENIIDSIAKSHAEGRNLRYEVIDNQTGSVMGDYETLRRAHNKADKLDNAYGAVRYFVRRATS